MNWERERDKKEEDDEAEGEAEEDEKKIVLKNNHEKITHRNIEVGSGKFCMGWKMNIAPVKAHLSYRGLIAIKEIPRCLCWVDFIV